MSALIKYQPFSLFDRVFDNFFQEDFSHFEGIQKSLKDNVLTYQIALPENVNLSELKAEVKDNVISVSVPLISKTKKLEIKKASE